MDVSLSCEESSAPSPAPAQTQAAAPAQSPPVSTAASAPADPVPPVHEPEDQLGSTDETFDTFIVGPSNKFAPVSYTHLEEKSEKALTQKEINRQKLAAARKRNAEKYGDYEDIEVSDEDLKG